MKPRDPQLSLRFEADTPDRDALWHDGAWMLYLGGAVMVKLGGHSKDALLEGEVLHLPLPPEATPRQIRDRAEAWLRNQALRVIGASLIIESRRLGREAPAFSLSFANRASWSQADDKGALRFHWRLIEQPEAVISQIVRQAVAGLPKACDSLDLFAAAA